MERRRFLKEGSLMAIAGMTSIAGCSSGDNSSGGGNPEDGDQSDSSPSGSDSNTVLMVTGGGEYYFDPIGKFIESGEAVTFKLKNGSHSATAYKEGNGQATVTRIPEGAEAWDSGILSDRGATFEHTFETTGTYDYFCTPHKSFGMVGRLVVGEPNGPAEGSMPPDGKVPNSQTIVDQGAVSYSQFVE